MYKFPIISLVNKKKKKRNPKKDDLKIHLPTLTQKFDVTFEQYFSTRFKKYFKPIKT